MRVTSTIATSCASLSDATVKCILETGNFARRVRESRHDMNTINAELLALKTILEILLDDFSATEDRVPTLLVSAISGILECCNETIAQSHSVIAKFSMTSIRRRSWRADDDVANIKEHLRTVRATLDLALDHVSLYTKSFTPEKVRPSSPTKEQRKSPQTRQALDLLRRINLVRERTPDHGHRDPVLDDHLTALKECAEALYEESMTDEEDPKRSDSMDPEDEGSIMRNEQEMSVLSLSSEAPSNGIGTWLANVASASRTVQKPVSRPELVQISGQKKHKELGITHAEAITFYTESTTSSSYATSRSKQSRTRLRAGNPQPVSKGGKQKRRIHYAPSSAEASHSPVLGILDQYVNADKFAISRSKRQGLSSDETVALDWRLRNIGTDATTMEVETSLWEGADPNVADLDYGFLFIRAANQMPINIVRLLVEYGADVTRTDAGPYCTALHAAVLGNRLETVQYLIEVGAHIDAETSDGETPLHLALTTPHAYSIAKHLLEAGADVCGISLRTVVTASKVDSRERSMMVELLLAHGAEGDLNVQGCARRGKGLSVLGLI